MKTLADNHKVIKRAKICWIAGAMILLICGVMHLHGTFFSEDLYPEDDGLILLLKASSIQMTKAGNFWKLWIGFNALFSAGLIFMSTMLFYFSLKQFAFLRQQHFIMLLAMLVNLFFVWIGDQFMIPAFTISMLVPLLLFIAGYALLLTRWVPGQTGNDYPAAR